MKFYSETLNKLFDSEKECSNAELAAKKAEDEKRKALEKKQSERKADSEKVEAAYEAMKIATENYEKVLSDFCKKHGSYHTSMGIDDIDDLFRLFRIF